ncbi:MAG: succinate dehydrogenase, cytochrome b556 subunit [Methylococcales bacterium]
MNNINRPLSPHLQVYKLPLTGIISITHRMTGVMLAVGLIFFVYIVSAVAGGTSTYSEMQDLMGMWLFRMMYWGFIYALFFHLCHGVRHLLWDTGKSFDHDSMDRYAIIELSASVALTLFAFIFI